MKGVLARLWEMLRIWVRRVPASNTKVQLLETGTVRGRPLGSSIQISSTHTLLGNTDCLSWGYGGFSTFSSQGKQGAF